jgi:hypothetical protein
LTPPLDKIHTIILKKIRFCKFKLECKKEHSKNVCENKNCDKKCVDRHIKPCRNKGECKFMMIFLKCTFSHVALEEQNCGVNKHAKIMSDETGELKNLLRKNKKQFENKNKRCTQDES